MPVPGPWTTIPITTKDGYPVSVAQRTGSVGWWYYKKDPQTNYAYDLFTAGDKSSYYQTTGGQDINQIVSRHTFSGFFPPGWDEQAIRGSHCGHSEMYRKTTEPYRTFLFLPCWDPWDLAIYFGMDVNDIWWVEYDTGSGIRRVYWQDVPPGEEDADNANWDWLYDQARYEQAGRIETVTTTVGRLKGLIEQQYGGTPPVGQRPRMELGWLTNYKIDEYTSGSFPGRIFAGTSPVNPSTMATVSTVLENYDSPFDITTNRTYTTPFSICGGLGPILALLPTAPMFVTNGLTVQWTQWWSIKNFDILDFYHSGTMFPVRIMSMVGPALSALRRFPRGDGASFGPRRHFATSGSGQHGGSRLGWR